MATKAAYQTAYREADIALAAKESAAADSEIMA